jgi:hypothetical protein
MKKIIFIAVFSLGLGLSFNVFAAAYLSLPKNAPLLPIPNGGAPNVSNNINSPNSPANTNLQQLNQQSNRQQQPQQTPADTTTPPVAPITGNAPGPSTTFYWILIFVGLAGLLAAGAWVYWRFYRSP